MNKYQFLKLIIACFLLPGCSFINKTLLNTMDTEFNHSNREEIAESPKAIVIIGCSIGVGKCTFEWEHIESGQKVDTDNSDLFKNIRKRNNPKNYEILALEPGHYSFLFAKNYGFAYRKKSKEDLVSFNVQPGEVVYLGELNFNIKDSMRIYKAINVIDNYDFVKSDLNNYFPELTPKLQKRLLKINPTILGLRELNKKAGIIEHTHVNF